MAAPANKTLKDLNGKWIMQGVGWFLRKAISMATVTITVSEYVEADITHIDIKQVATGGLTGTTENRTLDWTYRDHKDYIFGSVKGKSRWVKLADVDDHEFIRSGFEDMEAEHIQSYVESNDNGWTVDQVWGFENVGGERRYTRRMIGRKGDDWKLARLVFDYHGSASSTQEDDGLAYE